MGKKRSRFRNTRQDATSARESIATDSINGDFTISSVNNLSHNVMTVCRLCETKDGPFLNIFDADNLTAKKIEEVMPFGVTENDCLPHKICFRCSAKVEELYEFIQKCTKTQSNLQASMGKRTSLVTKTKTRELWEEKLNKTNLSNEDICNALIKKAMEGIKDIPLNLVSLEEKAKPPSNKKVNNSVESIVASKKDKESSVTSSKNSITYQSDGETDEVTVKSVKLTVEKCDGKTLVTRTSRSKPEPLLGGLVDFSRKSKSNPARKSSKVDTLPVENKSTNNKNDESQQNKTQASNTSVNIDKVTVKPDPEKVNAVPEKVQVTSPPINIMDHVSTIKVNGVGTLFLCKLCNRNFLKKEVVMTHGCAKNNVPKDNFLQNHAPPLEVPKPPTVKYIKMDKDFKKSVTPETRSETTELKPVEKKSLPDALKLNIPEHIQNMIKVTSGPSSRIKPPVRLLKEDTPTEPTQPPPKANIMQENKNGPSLQFPGMPSLNSRYKLVPGPNNTFTLVEESTVQKEERPTEKKTVPTPKNKKRKTNEAYNHAESSFPTHVPNIDSSPEIIEVDDVPTKPAPIEQPYPVGLFQTVPHHSGIFAPNNTPQPPAFTTPAMKKQSYTIVQTGNPSKLLISTKPVAEEPQKKKSRKSKPEENNKDPYSVVTIEDNAPPKDTSFFSFINVDPLLQPSYVLPTDNIIQESQISTSTPGSKATLDSKEKDKYSCNMCGEKFSREKKLLAHIQSHYNQMDEEDQMRARQAGPKKKTRKS